MARIISVTFYQASDGAQFDTLKSAEEHEIKIIVGNTFTDATDPLISMLSKDQAQAVIRHFSRNVSSIITELELSQLI